MTKTTVYLPDELKRRIEAAAARERISEAEVIRRSLEATVGRDRPAPRGGLFRTDGGLSDRVDELLAGFGEH